MGESFTQIGLPGKPKTQCSEISTPSLSQFQPYENNQRPQSDSEIPKPLMSEVPKTGDIQMQHFDDFHQGHLFPFKTHGSVFQTTSVQPSQSISDNETKQPNNVSRGYFLLSGDIYLVKPPHSVRAFTQEEVDVATFLGNYPNKA